MIEDPAVDAHEAERVAGRGELQLEHAERLDASFAGRLDGAERLQVVTAGPHDDLAVPAALGAPVAPMVVNRS